VRAVYGAWLSMYVAYAVCVAGSALGLRPFGGPLFPWLAAVLGAVAGGLLTARHRVWPEYARQVGNELGSTSAERVAVLPIAAFSVLAALTLGAMAVLAVLGPVGAYDAIGYRLPAVAQWLDVGAVAWVPGDDMLRNGYPLALEVLEAALSVATDSMAGVEVLGVTFLALGSLALATEARALGASQTAAAAGAALFALVPMHVLNAPSGYADTPFSAALVTLIFTAARFARGDADFALRILLGVSAGFTIAFKPPGIAFAGIVLGLASILRRRHTGLGETARALVVPLVVLVPGLFFLVRNIVVAHNPLYPLEVRAFGQVIFPGEGSLDGILTPDANVPKALRALPRLLRTPSVWLQLHGPARAFDERLAGLGYAFPGAALPALAVVLWLGFKRRIALRGLGFITVCTALLFAIQPFSFWPRFTTWLWGAGAYALVLGFDALSVKRARVASALVTALALAVGSEALYALAHVKYIGLFGRGLWHGDAPQRLADASGVSAEFVRTTLVGRKNVCRTGWTDGTDDANLDGIVAQLKPRPHMHVVFATAWSEAEEQMRSFGCDELIAIGQSPLRGGLPDTLRVRPARAFGFVDVIGSVDD
jgi:hypothetical protein